ncbi:MAG: hypothetical protein ACPW61_06450 [Methyloligella sp. ZOD6]
MRRITLAMAAAFSLGLAGYAVPAAAAPGAATATGVQSAVPAKAGVVDVGWRRKCRRKPWRCRRGGPAFALRAPGVGIYIDGDRDRYRYRHRYRHHHRWDDDWRWKRRWRRDYWD